MNPISSNGWQLLEAADFNLARGNYDAAFDQYFEAFTQEFCEDAQKRLTLMTSNGQLRPEQLEKLFAHHNSLDSQRGGLSSYNVALLYENGIGQLKPDLGVAVRYYENAVSEHVRDAYANLAQILISGSAETYGVSRDVTRGLELLARGVELGSRECAYKFDTSLIPLSRGRSVDVERENPKTVPNLYNEKWKRIPVSAFRRAK